MNRVSFLTKSILYFLIAFSIVTAGIDKGEKAPDFKLQTLDGSKSISLSGYKGKVVLVDFWATWCAPCKISMPKLEKLAKKYPDLYVVAINIDDDKAKAIEFLKDLKLDVTALYDANKKTVEAYDVPEMPTAYLVDQYGEIQYIHSGYQDEDIRKLEFAVRAIVDIR